jgi:hypothetical protein
VNSAISQRLLRPRDDELSRSSRCCQLTQNVHSRWPGLKSILRAVNLTVEALGLSCTETATLRAPGRETKSNGRGGQSCWRDLTWKYWYTKQEDVWQRTAVACVEMNSSNHPVVASSLQDTRHIFCLRSHHFPRSPVFHLADQAPNHDQTGDNDATTRSPSHEIKAEDGEMKGCNNFCSFANEEWRQQRLSAGQNCSLPHVDIPPSSHLHVRDMILDVRSGG